MTVSVCRSVAISVIRSGSFKAKTALPKSAATSFTSTSKRPAAFLSRSIVIAAVGSMESMMPLHSAIASARLKSFIAVDSSRWSWLSQGFKEDF
ncbi:hypothetical protein ZOSMA_92G00880 [Zostera marina]|uniref:Uncharacterized protein n=1 Tax=Zostera marina TaxID=29655 RepID=A0A0K9NJD3_ZOSMR|nr:hypothetical protein ZOSMA_92G00880 [Zostera marina]